MQQSIDTAWPPGPQQQTRHGGVRRPNNATDGQTDRQTDGRTPDRFIDPAGRTMGAMSTTHPHGTNVPN